MKLSFLSLSLAWVVAFSTANKSYSSELKSNISLTIPLNQTFVRDEDGIFRSNIIFHEGETKDLVLHRNHFETKDHCKAELVQTLNDSKQNTIASNWVILSIPETQVTLRQSGSTSLDNRLYSVQYSSEFDTPVRVGDFRGNYQSENMRVEIRLNCRRGFKEFYYEKLPFTAELMTSILGSFSK